MVRIRQAAKKRTAGDEEDEDNTSTSEQSLDTTDDLSSATTPPPSNKRKKSKQSTTSYSSSASLPFGLPDPRSALDVYACGLNTSDSFADLMVKILHRAIAHYATIHSLPYPEPADGYGCNPMLNDPPADPSTPQLSFFNHVPDTELILLPDTRITAIPVPSSSSPPPTLSSLAASHSIPYRRGMGYYQLTRPEKVSDTKQIIVRCDEHAIYMSGRAARFGPGIPLEKTATVDPAELESGWTVWVQSTSANRKLEAGTTALFDVDPSQKWPIG